MGKITPAIYKIDLNKLATASATTNPSATSAHAIIRDHFQARITRGQSAARPFNLVAEQIVRGYQVAVYRNAGQNKPHAWTNLFPDEIPNLEVKYPNLAAFFAKGDDVYAISSGMGFSLFEQFINTSFPLETARRIMNPHLNATTERDIAGAVYGRVQQFRTSQMVVSSQNLGTVWQAIKGDITEQIKSRTDFIEIYHPGKGRICVDAGSSLKIHRSLEIQKLAQLLDWISDILDEDVPAEQEEAFRFLDSLKEVSPRKNADLIIDVKNSLGAAIIATLRDSTPVDLDFSHKNFTSYQSAEEYRVGHSSLRDTPWIYPPTATEVLSLMHGTNLLNLNSGQEMIESLDTTNFRAECDDVVGGTHGSILDHLHGEIVHNETTYFMIDGKLYVAKSSFIERVSDDFSKLLGSNFFVPSPALNLAPYLNSYSKEADYNESYVGQSGWLVADRVFYENIEIADLYHWNDDQLFIIHNKIGFGVTVRDVCSQILHSMNIINRFKLTSDAQSLERYYDKIAQKHYSSGNITIQKDDFVQKVLRTDFSKIVYTLGYAQARPVTSNTQSNIAKFEAVKLCNNDRRSFDFELKIAHIEST